MSKTTDKTAQATSGESSTAEPSVEMDTLQSQNTTANSEVDERPAAQQAEQQQQPTQTDALPLESAAPTDPAASLDPPAPILTFNPETGMYEDLTSQQPSTTATTAAAAEPATETPAKTTSPNPLDRTETEAIGPSSENPTIKTDPTAGPAVVMTLLLTTGARHPYKIDEKYLKKRNVSVEDMDPFNVSVYTLKELILRDWRDEWESKPSAPTSIRLIYMGRLLDDRDRLKDCRFNEASPNVIHMTIKPQDIVDDEEAGKTAKGSARDRDGDDRSPVCRCVIL